MLLFCLVSFPWHFPSWTWITIVVDSCPSVPVQGGQAIPLYLEAILVMLSSLSTALQQEKEFINVIWWVQEQAAVFPFKQSVFAIVQEADCLILYNIFEKRHESVLGSEDTKRLLVLICKIWQIDSKTEQAFTTFNQISPISEKAS